MKAKKYWLIIESYCFIHSSSEHTLVINTLSSDKIKTKRTKGINDIIEKLLNPESLYCAEISDIELKNEDLSAFIERVKKTFSGDLVLQKHCKIKPVTPYPLLKLQRQISNLEKIEEISTGIDILTYLSELTLFVNGECSHNCNCCSNAHKQILYCTKTTKKELNLDDIKIFIKKIQGSGLSLINIVGGNIFKYSNLKELTEFLKGTPYKVNYHIHYKNIVDIPDIIPQFYGENVKLSIKVNTPIDIEKIIDINSKIKLSNVKHNWSFLISSKKEFNHIEKLTEILKNESIELLPFYDGNNYSFFEGNVFLDDEDILS